MNKIEELEKLKQEFLSQKAMLPLGPEATNLVFGEGNADAIFMFIGEAPGFNEDRTGRPFVGQAGKLLDKTLLEVGLTRPEVYITNIVKARPPENRDPTPQEIEAYGTFLDKQIEIIDPPVIVTLGRFSMAKYLDDVKISQVHGRAVMKGKRIILPQYHPAAALRAGAMLEQFRNDFKLLTEIKTDLHAFIRSLTKIDIAEKEDGQAPLF